MINIETKVEEEFTLLSFNECIDEINSHNIYSNYFKSREKSMSLIDGIVIQLQNVIKVSARYLGLRNGNNEKKEDTDRQLEAVIMAALNLLKIRDYKAGDKEGLATIESDRKDLYSALMERAHILSKDCYDELSFLVTDLNRGIPETLISFKR